MSKVSYLEFRPGRWVKLVDGKVAGPATPEEVAAWRREQAEQARIWEDVLRQAPAPESQPARPAPAPTRARETAERPRPRAKPKLLEEFPISEAIPGVAEMARPTAKAALPVEVAKVEHKPEAKIAPPVEVAKPEPRPTVEAAPPVEVAKAEPKPEAKVAPRVEVLKVEPKPKAKAAPRVKVVKVEHKPEAKIARPKEIVKPKPKPEAKVAPRVEELEVEPKPKAKAAPPVKVVKVEHKPEAKIAPPEKAAKAKPGVGRRRTPTARRRTAKRKAPPTASTDRLGQLYLWIMAGPTDDLAATVRTWLPRYAERFKQPAGVVLCHAEDLVILGEARLPVDVRQANGVPLRNFWLGPK